MASNALVWVIERDDGDVMERFESESDARAKFAIDLYDQSEYRLAQRWLVAIPEPFWAGWWLRKAQCTCGSQFRHVESYRRHWVAAHSQSLRQEGDDGE